MKAYNAKDYAFAKILAMEVGDQNAIAIGFAKARTGIKEDQDAQKESAKVVGKLACALEIRLENGKKAGAFAANYTLTDLFKDITGAKPPTHVMTLKNVFGAFVATASGEVGLITELDYDCNSGNCLQIANEIWNAVKHDRTHQAVSAAAAQLKERSNKAAKNLREILATVKPATKLTPEEALENFQQICDDGQLAVCLAQLPDIAVKMSETDQKTTYLAYGQGFERMDIAFGQKAEAWTADVVNFTAAPLAQAA